MKSERQAGSCETEEAERAARRQRVVRTLNLILAFSIGAYQLPFQADTEAVFPRDPARAATALATAASVSGMLEFLLCPTIGRAADTLGRKFFFLVQGLLTSVVYAVAAAQGGTWVPLLLAGKVLRTMNYAMCSASGVLALTMFGDVLTAKGFVVARANMVAVSGVVSALVPVVGARIMRHRAGARGVYAATAALALGQVAAAAAVLPETLAAEQRRPLALANPFGFVRLFTHSASMTRMMLASLTTNFLELKNLNDLYVTWYRNEVDVDLDRFRSLLGLTMIPSGLLLVPALIGRLGMFGFTAFANCTNAASWALTALMPWSRAQPKLMYLSLLLMLPGVTGNSGSALRACAMKYGAKAGLSSGEYAGFQANLKAIGGTVAPALYGRVYSYCKQHGRPPALCWAVVAFICSLMPEVLWRSIPNAELRELQDKP